MMSPFELAKKNQISSYLVSAQSTNFQQFSCDVTYFEGTMRTLLEYSPEYLSNWLVAFRIRLHQIQ